VCGRSKRRWRGRKIFLATQHDASVDEPRPDEIYSVGTIANIVQSLKLSDGNIKVLVEGSERAEVVSVSTEDGYFRATVKTFVEQARNR
jgi:ATP-dependent Lon protease